MLNIWLLPWSSYQTYILKNIFANSPVKLWNVISKWFLNTQNVPFLKMFKLFLALRELCVIILETLWECYLLWMFWKISSKQWRLNMLHNRPTKTFQKNSTMNDVQMAFWEQITLNTNILLMLLEKHLIEY